VTSRDAYNRFVNLYQEKSQRFFAPTTSSTLAPAWAPSIIDDSVADVRDEAELIDPNLIGDKLWLVTYQNQIREYGLPTDFVAAVKVEVLDIGGPPFPILNAIDFQDVGALPVGPYMANTLPGFGFGEPTMYYIRNLETGQAPIGVVAVTVTGNLANGSALVTAVAPSTNGLVTGMPISGTGVPAATVIQTVTGASTLTLSQAASATGTGVSLVMAGTVSPGINVIGLDPIPGRTATSANLNVWYDGTATSVGLTIDLTTVPDPNPTLDLPIDFHDLVPRRMCILAALADNSPNLSAYTAIYNDSLLRKISLISRGRTNEAEIISVNDY